MRLLAPIIAFGFLATPTAAAADFAEHTLTLSSWPLTEPTATPYAQAVYNTKTGSGKWRVLGESEGKGVKGEVVRVGWEDEKGRWRGVVIEGKALKTETPPTITLHVDSTGAPWNVELTTPSTDEASSPSYEDLVDGVIRQQSSDTHFPSSSHQTQGGKVKIQRLRAGVLPELNRPVVLDKEGKLPEPEVERTFWQKYWWMILGGGALLMSSLAAPEE